MNFQPPDPPEYGHCLNCKTSIHQDEVRADRCIECETEDMTNKPMLSVERELLESFAAYVADSPNAVMRKRAIQLRALLDKPNSWPCWSCKKLVSMSGRADADGDCPHCSVELDIEAWPFPPNPAAQHQGEPVAVVVATGGPHDMEDRVLAELQAELPPIGTKLYAEQTAPVADGTTSDKYKAELYDEVWQKARDMGFANVTDALAKLGAPDNSAPVAVAMPERKTKADYSGYIEQFQSEAAGLYNSALDDVARLNGVKP